MKIRKVDMILIGLSGLFLTAFSIYLVFFEEKVFQYYNCSDLKNFKKTTFSCVVKGKYIDRENHSVRTIQLVNREDIIVLADTSKFYDFIAEDDSIIKSLDTDTINVYREGQIYNFKIYFGCSD